MELEVGMYVRTKSNHILKITNLKDNTFNDEKSRTPNAYYPTSIIFNASHNIIDLIEVGDYVNGYYVEDIRETYVNIATGSNYFQKPSIDEEDIKSIVTKEAFESMSYKIGD